MKKCPNCNRILPLTKDFFYKDSATKNGFSVYCKQCKKARVNGRYEEAKDTQIARRRNRQQEMKQKCVEYKGSKCSICGYTMIKENLAVFDFHHRDPRTKSFAIMRRVRLFDWDVIKKELDKCDLLCANCHRILHSTYWRDED